MGGGDLNMKKHFHPLTMQNLERVWKAEQKAKEEAEKLEQLQRELEEERRREALQQHAVEQGMAKKKSEKLSWMYAGPQVNHEEYLLGRKIDKNVDILKEASETTEKTPGASFVVDTIADPAKDMAAKIKEDPLFLIKKKEEDSKKELVQNPIKLKKLKEMLNMSVNDKRKHKKQKKDKKAKHKKQRKRNSSESSEDEVKDRNRGDGRRGRREEVGRYRESGKFRITHSEDDATEEESKKSKSGQRIVERGRRDSSSEENGQKYKSRYGKRNGEKRRRDSSSEEDQTMYQSKYGKRNGERKRRDSSREGDRPKYHSKRARRNYEKRGRDSSSEEDRTKYRSKYEKRNVERRDYSSEEETHDYKSQNDKRNVHRRRRDSSSEEDRTKQKVKARTRENGKESMDHGTKGRYREKQDHRSERAMDNGRMENKSSSTRKYGLITKTHEELPKKIKKKHQRQTRDSSSESEDECNAQRSKKSRTKGVKPRRDYQSETDSSTEDDRKHRRHRKSSTDSDSDSHRPKSAKVARHRPEPPPRMVSNNISKKLNADELEKRRKEMMENAKWRDDQRGKNVKQYKLEDEMEEEVVKKQLKSYDRESKAKFIHEMQVKSYSTSSTASVEDRIKRNIYTKQRTQAALNKKFTEK